STINSSLRFNRIYYPIYGLLALLVILCLRRFPNKNCTLKKIGQRSELRRRLNSPPPPEIGMKDYFTLVNTIPVPDACIFYGEDRHSTRVYLFRLSSRLPTCPAMEFNKYNFEVRLPKSEHDYNEMQCSELYNNLWETNERWDTFGKEVPWVGYQPSTFK
ncbi:hypothetical protein L9F63_028385, partial [Diploptera punctata]